MIKEQLLRDCVEEAIKERQTGLFIWSSQKIYDIFSDILLPGNEYYSNALSQIAKGKEAYIDAIFSGIRVSGVVAVSVQKLSSEKSFKKFLKENTSMEGPIVFIPSNEVSKHCKK